MKSHFRISTRHILLKFLYLGWDYHGYATQLDNKETVEEHLMTALKRSCLIKERETSNYHRCGRTDAGVSAFMQVVSLDVRSKLENPTEKNTDEELDYCKMLNRLLPVDIRCYAWAHVSPQVSSRFDCTSRSYNYFFPRGNLNIEAMQTAAKCLAGTHDFRNLCKMDVGNGVVEFIRTIDSVFLELYKDDAPSEFQMMVFMVKSRGFLWHQIRCIMAVLLLVGEEKELPDIVEKLLNINGNPCKPQYHMAVAFPLSLSTAEYEHLNLKWNTSDEEIAFVTGQLQAKWTEFAVKSSLLRESLHRITPEPLKWQRQTHLYSGIVSKEHVPLLKRPTCQSLEERINHVASKKIKRTENQSYNK